MAYDCIMAVLSRGFTRLPLIYRCDLNDVDESGED